MNITGTDTATATQYLEVSDDFIALNYSLVDVHTSFRCIAHQLEPRRICKVYRLYEDCPKKQFRSIYIWKVERKTVMQQLCSKIQQIRHIRALTPSEDLLKYGFCNQNVLTDI